MRTTAMVLATLMTGLPAIAQDRFADVVIEAEPVAPAVYYLTGAGGNMGLVVGDRHAFLIDDQYAPIAERIATKIATLTDRPLTFLLNTHWHGDHSGGNASFAGDGVVVIAHENVRKRMSTEQVTEFFDRRTPSSPDEALPVLTFTRDLTLHLGGQRVEITHVPTAHTDGDAVVFLLDQNVLHMGDVFFHTWYPYIDVDAGGSIRGVVAAASAMLAVADDETRIIPGHGPMARRDDLRAYRDFLTTVADAIEAHIREGHTLAETVAAKPTAAFDATFNANGFLEPDRWVAMVYRDLARTVPHTLP